MKTFTKATIKKIILSFWFVFAIISFVNGGNKIETEWPKNKDFFCQESVYRGLQSEHYPKYMGLKEYYQYNDSRISKVIDKIINLDDISTVKNYLLKEYHQLCAMSQNDNNVIEKLNLIYQFNVNDLDPYMKEINKLNDIKFEFVLALIDHQNELVRFATKSNMQEELLQTAQKKNYSLEDKGNELKIKFNKLKKEEQKIKNKKEGIKSMIESDYKNGELQNNDENVLEYTFKQGFTLTMPSNSIFSGEFVQDNETINSIRNVSCNYKVLVSKWKERKTLDTNPGLVVYKCDTDTVDKRTIDIIDNKDGFVYRLGGEDMSFVIKYRDENLLGALDIQI